MQRRFVSDVSHELRTPLTTVRMAGDVLHEARRDFDPATARAAELLQLELDRFETLLADLLEISRFDAGAAVLETDDVNLVDVAHRVVDTTRALAEQRKVRLEVEAPGPPVPGRGRRTPGRAGRAQPGHQRHRPRPPGRHADRHRPRRHPGRRRRPGGGDRGARLRRRAGAGRVGDGVQPVLAGRPGPGADQRRHRARAVDLDGGHPPARRLAAGVGPARARARSSGSPCPAGSAARCGRARCRWCPRTRRSRSDEPRARPPWPRWRVACLVLTGCGVGMPDSGPVHETSADRLATATTARSTSTRCRPGKGDSPDEIVTRLHRRHAGHAGDHDLGGPPVPHPGGQPRPGSRPAW